MQNYVLNTWYPLAWSREIKNELSAHRIVEQDVVLFRKSSGEVVAMEDMCPHRFFPLSKGRLRGDSVECGYHGLTFDCSGKCTRVPGQEMVPSNARVTTYPIQENLGIVWIWMGDPELADKKEVFDLPQYNKEGWSVVEGDALVIKANYLSLADNLCDPSHVSFVHLSTLGNSESEDIPVQYEVFEEEKKIVTWRWVLDGPPIPLFAKYGNFKGNVDRWHYYHYYSPSIAIIDFGSADAGTGAPEGARDNCIQIYACHFMTPVDERTTIDHWLHIKNFNADQKTNKSLSNDFRIAFAEDKEILEAIQIKEEEHPERKKLKISIDGAPIRMRRMQEKAIKLEEAVLRK